jgi:hypothetical protein
LVAAGFACIDDERAGGFVVPGLLLVVPDRPEVTNQEHEGRHQRHDVANQAFAVTRYTAAVLINDLQTEHPAANSLSRTEAPRVVDETDEQADRRRNRVGAVAVGQNDPENPADNTGYDRIDKQSAEPLPEAR